VRYEFSGDAFSRNIPVWERLFACLMPCEKILEIGSYEGRSAVWQIENVLNPRGGGELCCIDPFLPSGVAPPDKSRASHRLSIRYLRVRGPRCDNVT
jgi:hypothetical protein